MSVMPPNNVTFIGRKDHDAQSAPEPEDDGVYHFPTDDEMAAEFHRLANQNAKIHLPRKEVNRKRVVQAFADAFQMIGGVPRLAVWANENPDEFFKLYARLLPSQSSAALGDVNEMRIIHVLPTTALDKEPS